MANGQRKTAGAVIQGSFVGGRFTPPGVPAPAASGRATNPHINQHSVHVRQIVQAKMAQPRATAPRAMAPRVVQPRAVTRQSPVVQRHGTGEAFHLPAHLSNFGGGGGQPLPAAVLQKMESFFGTSFGDIRVHVGPQASAIGALAFTHGSNLYFAQGQYNPNTTRGQQILAHELTHVVQQRAGRVRNPFGSGVAVVQDRGMEAEADRMGHLAALHKEKSSAPVAIGRNGANHGTGQDAVQPMLWAVGMGVVLGVGALAYCLRGRNVQEELNDDGSDDDADGSDDGGGGGGGEGKVEATPTRAKKPKKPATSSGSSPLDLLKREARREGAERTSSGWPIYQREIKARLAILGKGAEKAVREAFMDGATAAARSAPPPKPYRLAPRRAGGGGGGGLSEDERAEQAVENLLGRLRGAIGRYEVYSKKDSNVARQGCVKNGPSEFVDRDLKQLVFAKLQEMEGEEFEGGRLRVVTLGKNAPQSYDLTLQGDYRAYNPKTMAILHIE